MLSIPKPLSSLRRTTCWRSCGRGSTAWCSAPRATAATYLPQVWEQLPDKQAFMNELAEKAGLSDDAWRLPGAEVLTYQVEAFKEEGIGD